jgi:membrane fusion protein (multidrug efflux system)
MDEVKKNGNNHGKKIIAAVVFACIGVAGLISVFFYIHYKASHITTDDAFIDGHIHSIAPKIPGTVKAVFVEANQAVKKGNLLVEIDPTDYDVRVGETRSSLSAEKSRQTEYSAQVETDRRQLSEMKYRAAAAEANLNLQEAKLRQAELDRKRAENLVQKEAISRERADQAKTAYDVAAAQVKAAKDQLKQAEATIETQQGVIRHSELSLQTQAATVKQREATLKAAQLNRGYTRIYAPVDGFVTKKSVEVGNQIQPGQPLMAVVPLDNIYVIANYKETEIEKIKPGLKVEVRIDTYPGKVFQGNVDSIMAGTGAVFSLFPPENATGNYVKVVQRIPVKIILDKGADPDHILRVGMSVVPTIIVRE